MWKTWVVKTCLATIISIINERAVWILLQKVPAFYAVLVRGLLFLRKFSDIRCSASKEHEEAHSKRVLLFFAAMKGLYFNQPGHSCKDIRDSGDSKGDGEYWIDPEKGGHPFKVYCDMTTDGGKLRIMIWKGKLSEILGRSAQIFHSFRLRPAFYASVLHCRW